ncbi:MAG: hypothetical protein QF570_04030 [Myxococcota bacterium]|nr:hypothetical protein [Myxococcota bacterium]
MLPQTVREDVEIVTGRFSARERLYRRVEATDELQRTVEGLLSAERRDDGKPS